MSNEVALRPAEVVNPATGNVLALSEAATDALAAERRDVTDLTNGLRLYAHELDAELTARLDKGNTRSAEVGGWRIETKAPTTTDYPVDALEAALRALILKGHLEAPVLDRVLIPQPPKLNRTEVTKLAKHANPEVREAVAAVAVETDQPRRVSVKPL